MQGRVKRIYLYLTFALIFNYRVVGWLLIFWYFLKLVLFHAGLLPYLTFAFVFMLLILVPSVVKFLQNFLPLNFLKLLFYIFLILKLVFYNLILIVVLKNIWYWFFNCILYIKINWTLVENHLILDREIILRTELTTILILLSKISRKLDWQRA